MQDVSVVIPCYKQAHFLPDALQSVLEQSFPAREIIVVDDGSPDGVADVVQQFPGVQSIRQRNRGLAAARNAGLRASHGEYVVFLDADDRLLPNHLETGLRGFDHQPSAALVIGDYRYFGAEGLEHQHNCGETSDMYARILRGGFPGSVHTVMVRRAILDKVGAFRTSLRSAEDHDLWLRIARCAPVYCHHELVAEYRRYEGQMSRQWDVMLRSVLRVHGRQWSWVRGHREREAAFWAGLRHHLMACGEPLLWQTVECARQKQWRVALRYLRTLLRYYPEGVLRLVSRKVLGQKSWVRHIADQPSGRSLSSSRKLVLGRAS